MRHTHGFSLGALFILLLANTSAWALPSVNSETAVEDRIRVSLYVNEKTINGDTESYCRVYVSTNVAGYFQEGEELRVKVWANDVQILSINESLTSADETSGSIYKNYNCQGSFGTASTHDIKTNVYLEDDRWLGFAEEIDISVTSEGVDDDTAEENDTASNATPLTTESVEYILRDDDYLELNIEPPAATELIIYAYFNEGPIRVSLLDEVSLAVEESFEISNDFVRELDLGNLTESRYFVKLEPLYGSDYNFYQIQYTATSTGDCTPGDTEMRPCGNCGSQTRECNSEGQWQLFETCQSEGICEAGDTQTIACEEEGVFQEELCDLTCNWLVTEPCPPPPILDAGMEELDAGDLDPMSDAGTSTSTTTNEDAGNEPVDEPSPTADAGNTNNTSDRIEQPPGQISDEQGGCACQEDKSTNDGRVPTLMLLFIWWLSVRKTRRGKLSYFGRTFQGRWVSRHD